MFETAHTPAVPDAPLRRHKPIRIRVQPTPEAVHVARRTFAKAVREAQLPLSSSRLADAVLCAAEVLANAERHTQRLCELTAYWTGSHLHVEVADSSPEVPEKLVPAPSSRSGRGLLMVHVYADRWGIRPPVSAKDGWTKAVWFEIGPEAPPEPLPGQVGGAC
ncbi:ATP-binding protein [Kitasatospora sp. NBC_01287]|uniref:ATP-binding protein n=1 Tax=Kitasatospora sp. NBC_01287 TaxID=2903573 RepID=UPI0022580A40|nr:ATP-binding protein [Kitasatospora sp. NBC_01287]MCX4751606.1 ATP-binding protein [Kitasatospora sp. NBC_01287]